MCVHLMSTPMQIIDGFFVKRTKDIRDSVAYLTIMTRTLQQHYSVSHEDDKEGRGLIKLLVVPCVVCTEQNYQGISLGHDSEAEQGWSCKGP